MRQKSLNEQYWVKSLFSPLLKRFTKTGEARLGSRRYDSYFDFLPGCCMQVTEKGQVTIPKHIRLAAGVLPGSEVEFSLEGSKIVITPVGTGVRDDRRAKLRAAASLVRASLSPEFRQLGADEIMAFLRGDDSKPISKPAATRRGRR